MTDHNRNGISGLCVGDALGVPVEFVDRDALSRKGFPTRGTQRLAAGKPVDPPCKRI